MAAVEFVRVLRRRPQHKATTSDEPPTKRPRYEEEEACPTEKKSVVLCTAWGPAEACPLLWFPNLAFQQPSEELTWEAREDPPKGGGPFSFSDPTRLANLFIEAGLKDVQLETWGLEVSFPSFEVYFEWATAAVGAGELTGEVLKEKRAGLWRDITKLAPALVGSVVVEGLTGDSAADQASLPVMLPCQVHVAVGYG